MPTLPKSQNSLLFIAIASAAFASAACSGDGGDDEGSSGGGGSIVVGGSTGGSGATSPTGGAPGTQAGGSPGAAGGSTADLKFIFCGPGDTCPSDFPAGFDATTPVSFATEIYAGYFRDGCGGSGCHSVKEAPAADMYLGSTETPLTPVEITALIAQLKGPSTIAAGATNVIPADWQNSFLMAKLDGCQSTLGLTCDLGESARLQLCDQSCGDGMPVEVSDAAPGGTDISIYVFPTTPEERIKVHKVRAWIQQGALDN